MKAIRVVDSQPHLVDVGDPTPSEALANAGELVEVTVVSSSICGSDLHMLPAGYIEGRIPGHEFAGRTADGTPVAIEPLFGCGTCGECMSDSPKSCFVAQTLIGVTIDGGMAEKVLVPASTLVPLDAGIDLTTASLIEPLTVAEHGLNRAAVESTERVCVIGAGPIGLAAAAMLRARGVDCAVAARHPHQQVAAERLGATVVTDDEARLGGYDVVVDAVGTTESIRQAVASLRPRGRIAMVGTQWEPASFDVGLAMREVTIIPSMMYGYHQGTREMDTAARVLCDTPDIADAMISHRFPLDAVDEAFAAAAARAAGAIKVVFDVATP